MAFRAIRRNDDPKWKKSSGEPASGELFADFVNPYKGTVVKASDGHSLPCAGYDIVAGETFDAGDLVRLDGDDAVYELTAVTQTIIGVAAEAVSDGASSGPTSDICIVVLIQDTIDETSFTVKTRFAVKDVNDVTPATTYVGTNVAVAQTAADDWRIDVTDTTNEDVEILAIDTVRGEYIVRFLDAVVQS